MTEKAINLHEDALRFWREAANNPQATNAEREDIAKVLGSLALTNPAFWHEVLKSPESYGFDSEQAELLKSFFTGERTWHSGDLQPLLRWHDASLNANHWMLWPPTRICLVSAGVKMHFLPAPYSSKDSL